MASGAVWARAAFLFPLLLGGQEWRYYGGDPGGSKYSTLKDINRANVQKLRPAWIFHTDHLRPRPFCVSLCTPRQQPGENQIAALVFAIKQILRHYRAAVGYAGRL